MIHYVFHVLIFCILVFQNCLATYDHNINNKATKYLGHIGYKPASEKPLISDIESSNTKHVQDTNTISGQLIDNEEILNTLINLIEQSRNENVDPLERKEGDGVFDNVFFDDSFEDILKPLNGIQKQVYPVLSDSEENVRVTRRNPHSGICASYPFYVKSALNNKQFSPRDKYLPEGFEALKCASPFEAHILNGHEFRCQELYRKQFFMVHHNGSYAFAFMTIPVACELRPEF